MAINKESTKHPFSVCHLLENACSGLGIKSQNDNKCWEMIDITREMIDILRHMIDITREMIDNLRNKRYN